MLALRLRFSQYLAGPFLLRLDTEISPQEAFGDLI